MEDSPMERYVGLDVHSKQTSFCIQEPDGSIVSRGRFYTTEDEFARWSKRWGLGEGTHVALETGTQCKWVARILSALGLDVWVINAHEVRAKCPRKGQKSDGRDALELCDGLRRDQWVQRVWIPPVEIERLRQLLSRRRHFVKIRTKQINAARFVLRQAGLSHRKTLTTKAAWEALLARKDVGEELVEFLNMHYAMWRAARRAIVQLDKRLKEALKPFAHEIELLTSLFGVGQITAATFVAVIGDPKRFQTSGQVVSYVGLAPSTNDSGERERHGRITRQGSPMLRAAACESAHQARRTRHPLNPYFRRLLARHGLKRAVTAISVRIVRILWRMWRDDKPFDLAKLNVIYKPKVRHTRYIYMIKETPASV
jgi:transposase